MARTEKATLVQEVTAKTGGFTRAHQDMQAQVTKTTGTMQRSAGAMGKASGAMGTLARSVSGVAGAYAALRGAQKIWGEFTGQAQEASALQGDLQRAMIPTISLLLDVDASTAKNIETMRDYERELLRTSVAYQRTREEIAAFDEMVLSGSFGIAKQDVDELRKAVLELGKAGGGSLAEWGTAALKTWQNFGHQMKTPTDMVSKMALAQQLAFASAEDFASFLPRLQQSAVSLGHSMDETFGAIIAASQKGGSFRVTVTALENVMTTMEKATREGKADFSGPLLDGLQKLNAEIQNNKGAMQDMFGDSYKTAAGLAESISGIEAAVKRLRDVEGRNIAAEKLAIRAEHPGAETAEQISRFKALKESLQIERGLSHMQREAASAATDALTENRGMVQKLISAIPGIKTLQDLTRTMMPEVREAQIARANILAQSLTKEDAPVREISSPAAADSILDVAPFREDHRNWRIPRGHLNKPKRGQAGMTGPDGDFVPYQPRESRAAAVTQGEGWRPDPAVTGFMAEVLSHLRNIDKGSNLRPRSVSVSGLLP